MNKTWIRWTALAAFVVVLGIVFVNLGQWQLRRLEERQHKNAAMAANVAAPVRGFEEVFGPEITDEDQWQRVVVTGTFDANNQFQVRYRFNGKAPGYEVVTPLRTPNGTAVLVDRGFIEVPTGTAVPTVLPEVPAGEVTVVGHVRRSERGKSQAIDPVNHQVRLVNSTAIRATLPYPIVDGYLAALEVTPPQSGEFQPLVLPENSDGPHFWYAMQWFLFTGIGITGLVIFIRGDIRERRKGRAAAGVSPGGTSAAVADRTPSTTTTEPALANKE